MKVPTILYFDIFPTKKVFIRCPSGWRRLMVKAGKSLAEIGFYFLSFRTHCITSELIIIRITSYLEVTTAQSAVLSDQVTAVNILGRRMVNAVLLVQALGGGSVLKVQI
jgi:hypothetical protein